MQPSSGNIHQLRTEAEKIHCNNEKKTHYINHITGTARTQSRLTKITRPSYPHLGQSQGSTQPQCNGTAF